MSNFYAERVDWRALLGISSAVLYVIAAVPYVRAALRRSVRPNLVTWGGSTVVNATAFAAQMSAEPSWSALIAGVTACYCLLIVILTWRNGDRSLNRLDLWCLCIGAVAIVAWQLSDVAEVALFLSILADVILCIPMIEKTRRFPRSEIPSPFLIAAGAGFLSALSAAHIDAVSLSWPIWQIFVNGTIGLLALRTRTIAI